MKEPEMHLSFMKEIKGNKIYKVTRCDFTPENVGMIVARTQEGKEAPFESVEEAERFLEKYSL
ncbi:hypothetical protein [Cytobacillus praedii]|uniref:Uncharacterized protein n=1 Tax=Cytobacillus praedii TaxID=1742358 RepID=A0A4V2NTK0_9BACI|nr:hypothetical protein [Cytobacillus praedii]TCJ00498.1 hypothetical protein E0Y62_26610 [Cytobacillus praedii]